MIRIRALPGSFLLLSLLLPRAGLASPERYVVRGGDEGSTVEFVSKAAMETFKGKTRAVSGTLRLDPAALVDTLTISISVDLASLDTGIALRNRHMRENHLHTDRFPLATFEGARIVEGGGALEAGQSRRVTLGGALTLHGVTRPLTLPVDLVWDGKTIRLAAEFPVSLAEHGIPRPRFLVLKLGEVQQVSVSVVADRDVATAVPETGAPASP